MLIHHLSVVVVTFSCAIQAPSNSTFQSGPPRAGALGPIPPQAGVIPGQRSAQVIAPSPPPRGFMPVTSPGVVAQRPGMISTQPSSPTQPASAQATVAPPAPPPTIHTVDTSNVPGNLEFLRVVFHCTSFVWGVFWGWGRVSKSSWLSDLSWKSII